MSGRRSAGLAAMLACAALSGCRSPSPATCELYDCGGACVDIRLDSANCGACGRACLPGEVCSGGVCGSRCEAPLAACRAAGAVQCAAVQTDPANCGACGVSCREGEFCSAGSCSHSCEPPLVACGDREGAYCADLARDRLNCGGCARACAPGQTCDRGACADTCEGKGKSTCSGACVDLFTDDRHCGACGRSCAATEKCEGATCRDRCALEALTRCGESCVDLATDVVHCGSCGKTCAAGGTCRAGTCVAPACAGGIYLSGRPNLFDSFGATGLLAADFDGDGSTDLLLSEFMGKRILLLRGSKAGGFGAPENAVAREGFPVAAADLDGDGDQDVLVSEEATLTLYQNDGAAHFSAGKSFPFPDAAGAQVADFDGDGQLDVLAYGIGGIDLFLSTGAPTDRNLMYTYNVSGARAADVDGDGRPDIVVGTRNGPAPFQVFLNQGGGAYQAPIQINPNASPDALEMADLDGDGRPDAVYWGYSYEQRDFVLAVLRNVGGALTPGQSIALPSVSYRYDLLVSDLDGDGRPDAVFGESDTFRIYPNRGDGTFTAPVLVPSGSAQALAAFDVDGDARVDLVSASAVTRGVEVRRRLASGRYGGPEVLPIATDQALLTDMDGDGRDDLVTLVAARGWVGRGRIEVRHSGPEGFEPPLSSSGFGWRSVQAGDLDGDGAVDLVVGSDQAPILLLNAGDGTFRDEVPVMGVSGGALLADVTGDGILDLVDKQSSSPYSLRVAIGLGSGAFAPPVVTAPPSALLDDIEVGDVNGDGRSDVVAVKYYGQPVQAFLGRSDGTFEPPVDLPFQRPTEDCTLRAVAVGDLDGDGRAEVVALVSWFVSGASYYASALVVTRWPASAPASSEVIPLTSSRDALAIASMSGGGLAELLIAGYGSLGLLAASGDGGFLPEVRWSAPTGAGRSARPAAGDLDGDLRADVVLPAGDHVVVFRGTCPSP